MKSVLFTLTTCAMIFGNVYARPFYAGYLYSEYNEPSAAASTEALSESATDITDKTEVIEENLMVGLRSENTGLSTSTAYYLGELKSRKAVIDLMRMLHNSDDESVRILSALSLIKIDDARGVFAVKRAAQFDKSQRVKRMCAIFYNSWNENKTNAIENDAE
ncbi:MAG: HEAT repeat domain-containing protein [Bacteroidota bacterium]